MYAVIGRIQIKRGDEQVTRSTMAERGVANDSGDEWICRGVLSEGRR
jgi:hypothetical protein